MFGKNVYKNIEKKAEIQQKQIVLFVYKVLKMGSSHVFTTVESLQKALSSLEMDSIGFVPTMGALHHGHLSLVRRALNENTVAVVSIFVNPTQFNNQEDLEKYPRDLQKDIDLLNTVGDIIIFAPTTDEVYPSDFKTINLDLGKLETVMEGKFRKGHFKGVVNVVKRLFDVVQPTRAYFGLKDFQQIAVIKHMVKSLSLPIEIIGCEIVREASGLASSSRNVRLSEREKEQAIILFDALTIAKQLSAKYNPVDVQRQVESIFLSSKLKLEYFEIVDPETLLPLKKWVPGANACIAAYCGEVRLIDNMQLIEK